MNYVLDALSIRRDELTGKRQARANQPGFAENVREIETALAEINAEITRLEQAEQSPQD